MASLLLLVSLLVLSLCAVDSLRGSCRAAVFVSKSANVYANVYAPLAKSGFASGRSALRMSAGGEQEGIVTMYKKEGCPYCKKAIELLSGTYKLDIKFVDIEVCMYVCMCAYRVSTYNIMHIYASTNYVTDAHPCSVASRQSARRF